MMRRHLAGIPRSRLAGGVGALRGILQIGHGSERAENARGVAKLLDRQIATVRPGIGGQLFFVERLRRLKNILRRHGKHRRRGLLQGGQAEGQGSVLLLRRLRQRDDPANLAAHGSHHGFGCRHVHKATFRVKTGLRIAGPETRQKGSAVNTEGSLQDKIFLGRERRALPVPRNDQIEHGALHAPGGQFARMAAVAPDAGQRPRHVEPDKPVRAPPGDGRVAQMRVSGIVLHASQRLFHGERVQGSEPETPRGTAPVKMFKHFVNNGLSLSIRIARMHHGIRLLQQLPDGHKLLSGVLVRLEPPFPRYDRQATPVLPGRIVVFGHAVLKDVPEAPRHQIAAFADDMGILFSPDAQSVRDGAGKRGLFRNVYFHV